MKRLFALLLALVMLLTLTACGSGEEGATAGESTGTTVNTTENTNDPTNGTQSTTESTIDGDAVGATEPPATTTPTTEPTPDTTTQKPTEPKPTTPTPSEPKPTEPTPTEPTPTQPKPTEPQPTEPTPTEPTPTQPKPTEPTKPTEPEKPSEHGKTYAGYEIVSMNSPEQAILTRFYGKNKAFLKNDSMTIRIKMSNGTATKDDISVMEAYQCSYSISGDQVTVKFNGTKKQSILTLSIKNSDGSFDKVIFDVIVVQTENLSKDAGRLKELFVQYGNKNGLAFVPNGNDFVEKYNGGYTRDDKSKSITGCTIRGTDDYIRIVDNSDWIFEVLDLIDAYRNEGFNKWSFGINMGGGFSTLAE